MKKGIFSFVLLFFLFSGYNSFSESKNVIKTSVIPMFFKDYSLYFERRIHRNISFSIGGSYMPARGLPGLVANLSGGSVDLSKISFSGFSLTPEIRIYPGLKLRHPAPHGFYISVYAKARTYKADFPFAYNDTTTFNFSGKFTGVGIGLMLGHQWIIGNHFSIDWWIGGAHFGNLYSTFEVTDNGLNTVDKNQFIEKLQSVSFPQGKIETEVSGNTAKVTINAPYLGLRSGITLGVAF